jgi:hypothetical protein
MAGKFIRGALVEFMDTFLLPLPNVIIFQYNPETITHSWTQPEAAPSAEGRSNPLAVKGSPGESFQFTIAMDANDMISDGGPVEEGLATATGIYSRLAALEMLQYPVDPSGQSGLLGSVSVSVSVSSSGISLNASLTKPNKRSVPQAQIPTVLFIWGPGRILPVRVTNLSITEKLYDSLLNPTHAEATLGLRVLTPEELLFLPGKMGKIAKAAYTYSQGLRQTLAVANLAAPAADSILGMLPI